MWGFTLVIFIAFASLATSAVNNSCSSLPQNWNITNGVIHSAVTVQAGTKLELPQNNCHRPEQVVDVDICRVSMTVKTGPYSNVKLEAWLPHSWTGRLLVVGNGGLGGCIHYEDLNYGATLGFATVGTNAGHESDAASFYTNPGSLEDFVYRSISTASSVAKGTGQAFYGVPYTKSYYLGCSTGGRQGFKSVQSYPHEFDGVVAGAPALNVNALMYWSGRFYNLTGKPGSSTFLSSADWELVYADVVHQCDHLDGVVDGVLEDPQLCEYRPESLICGSGPLKTDNCLTGTQAATVRAVFSPLYGRDGQLAYPRLQPGANSTAPYFSGKPFYLPAQWFRYAIYGDPSWKPDTLNLDDLGAADRLNPFNAATWEGDLSLFRQSGGKVLHYHGLEDELISSENSIRYYNHVARTMNLTSTELDEFYRFFRISGMAHCLGGNGPSLIGNSKTTATSYDPEENVLTAIVRWVEDGIAPGTIRGTSAGVSGQPFTGAVKRDHCRYPMRNTYNGYGNPSLPSSWNCV